MVSARQGRRQNAAPQPVRRHFAGNTNAWPCRTLGRPVRPMTTVGKAGHRSRSVPGAASVHKARCGAPSGQSLICAFHLMAAAKRPHTRLRHCPAPLGRSGGEPWTLPDGWACRSKNSRSGSGENANPRDDRSSWLHPCRLRFDRAPGNLIHAAEIAAGAVIPVLAPHPRPD